jgi:hypothetical protein
MKTLMLIAMLLSSAVYGQTCNIKDGEVVGVVTRCDKAKWKLQNKINKLQAELDKTPNTHIITQTITKEVDGSKKNRLSILGGYGPQYVEAQYKSATIVEALQKYNGVIGLQYERQFNNNISGLIQGISNKTFMLGVGYGF